MSWLKEKFGYVKDMNKSKLWCLGVPVPNNCTLEDIYMSLTVFYYKKEIITDNLKIDKIMPTITVFVLDGTVLVAQDVYGHTKNVY